MSKNKNRRTKKQRSNRINYLDRLIKEELQGINLIGGSVKPFERKTPSQFKHGQSQNAYIRKQENYLKYLRQGFVSFNGQVVPKSVYEQQQKRLNATFTQKRYAVNKHIYKKGMNFINQDVIERINKDRIQRGAKPYPLVSEENEGGDRFVGEPPLSHYTAKPAQEHARKRIEDLYQKLLKDPEYYKTYAMQEYNQTRENLIFAASVSIRPDLRDEFIKHIRGMSNAEFVAHYRANQEAYDTIMEDYQKSYKSGYDKDFEAEIEDILNKTEAAA